MANYRKIYEQHYGVKIPKGYHVHHKDMNHENDDPLNLEALHPDDHAKKHGFLNNFIMAQSTANERAVLANTGRKCGEAQLKKQSIRVKGNRYAVGAIHTEAERRALSLRSMGNRYGVGYKRTDAQKRAHSIKITGFRHQKVTCSNCGMVGGQNALKRWHFENCKRLLTSSLR